MSSRGQTSPSVYGSERLRKVDLPLVQRSDCEAAYHKIDEETGHGYSLPDKIGETMLCAGYTEKTAFVNDRDSCAGDSGGPIIHTAIGAVVGVVSLGMPPCGKDGAPGVYANVRGLREFIEEHMG
jgi:secreted trypsin-like serine protease